MLKKNKLPQAIREAVDYCPGGLCFSMPDGRPILVNIQMNRLCAALTGHTVMDAEAMWTELCDLPDRGGCKRLEKPWAEDNGGPEDMLGFALPDGTMWQFHREKLFDADKTYIQIEATDITELFTLSSELYENNIRLKELQDRQKKLLANIVQINREKELLAVKMRVHDEFGQCLLATSKALAGCTLEQDGKVLAKNWEGAIRGLANIPLEDYSEASQEAELMQVAEMIGCKIEFCGERPADRGVLLLLYAAVREALTNAVRHAGADTLKVSMSKSSAGYRAVISDNGHSAAKAISEGDGLHNLRLRLEGEGATMDIAYQDGVVLILNFPCVENANGRRAK
jgi:hypothetical protein